MWVGGQTLRPLYPRERPGTHCIGGWVGLRAGLDGYGKSPPIGIRSPERQESGHICIYYSTKSSVIVNKQLYLKIVRL